MQNLGVDGLSEGCAHFGLGELAESCCDAPHLTVCQSIAKLESGWLVVFRHDFPVRYTLCTLLCVLRLIVGIPRDHQLLPFAVMEVFAHVIYLFHRACKYAQLCVLADVVTGMSMKLTPT